MSRLRSADNHKVIFCYAEGREERWEAVCLNFDLAVQGNSFDSVQTKLNDAIGLYLESIHDLPEADRKRLLNRRAPMLHWLMLAWRMVRASLVQRDDRLRHEFTLPLPENAIA